MRANSGDYGALVAREAACNRMSASSPRDARMFFHLRGIKDMYSKEKEPVMIKLRDLASPSRIFLKVKLGATTTNLLHFILVKIVSGISIVVFVADVAAGLGLLSRQLRVKPLHGLKNLAGNLK